MFGRSAIARPQIVGWGRTTIGHHPDRSPDDLAFEALSQALGASSLKPSDLDALISVPQGYLRAQAPIRSQRLAQALGVSLRSLGEVENGGYSAMLAFKLACLEVAVGHADLVAVVGAQAERDMTKGGNLDPVELQCAVGQVNAMYGAHLGPYGMVMAVPCYALAAQRYMYEHGVEAEDVAALAVHLRANAARNPHAELRWPLSVEEVLESRMVAPPIHKLESPPWSDGGAAAIVAGEEAARRLGLGGPVVTGWGEGHAPESFVPFAGSLTSFAWMREATDQALDRASRKRDDVQVAELYGAFAHAELITYESMGLFEPGEAPAAVKRGETAIDGAIAINPSGGRLSLGHPPQATPLLMLAEIADQLTEGAGDRQVGGARVGLVQAEHGMMNGGAVCVLET